MSLLTMSKAYFPQRCGAGEQLWRRTTLAANDSAAADEQLYLPSLAINPKRQ